MKEKSFAWDLDKVKNYKSFFEGLSKINQSLIIKFGNLEFLLKRFPPIYFE